MRVLQEICFPANERFWPYDSGNLRMLGWRAQAAHRTLQENYFQAAERMPEAVALLCGQQPATTIILPRQVRPNMLEQTNTARRARP